jgi:hypothetical protein
MSAGTQLDKAGHSSPLSFRLRVLGAHEDPLGTNADMIGTNYGMEIVLKGVGALTVRQFCFHRLSGPGCRAAGRTSLTKFDARKGGFVSLMLLMPKLSL